MKHTLSYRGWSKFLSVLALLSVAFVGLGPRVALGQEPAAARILAGEEVVLLAGTGNASTFVRPTVNMAEARNPSAATINVTYTGFTPEAQTAFQYAVEIWEAQLTSPVTIEVHASWEALPEGVLGSAGPANFYRDWTEGAPPPRANTWYPIALANKLAGVDLAPAPGTEDNPAHDITARFSSAFPNWYFGLDGNTPADTYDFVTVVLHELGHGLGFSGSARVTGDQGQWGLGTGFPFVYDWFVEDGASQHIIDQGVYPNPSTQLGDVLQGGALYFVGTASVAANGGERVPLYAPASWQQGSSYSHLDENTYLAGDPDSLMTPQLDTAEGIHDPGAVTRGIFTDMGWTTQVPTAVTLGNLSSSSTSTPTLPLLAGLTLASLGLVVAWRRSRA